MIKRKSGFFMKKGSRIKRKPLKRVVGRLKPNKRILAGQLRKQKKVLEALQKAVVIKKYGNDCFTCDATNLQKSNCQLGHVPWPRAILSTECKFDIRFTRIQCFRDNIHLGGQGAVALKRMQDEGIDTNAMWELNKATKGKVYSSKWFEEKILDYTEMLRKLNEDVTLG